MPRFFARRGKLPFFPNLGGRAGRSVPTAHFEAFTAIARPVGGPAEPQQPQKRRVREE